MSWAENFTFAVDKPNTDAAVPVEGWGKDGVISPWTTGAASNKATEQIPAYQTDEILKQRFGIELAKSKNPFEAGCKVFGEETSKALWASFNWLHDPVVVASRDAYLKTLELSAKPLDREQLAAKVLALAEEKVERNGVMVPTIEAKERINAFKLYSDIMGYTGKVEIDNSTKNFTHNEMTIKLVKADNQPHVIDNAPNAKSEMTNSEVEGLPIKLKLVSNA